MASLLTRRRRRSARSVAEENVGIGNASARPEKIRRLERAGWISLINLMPPAFMAQDVSSCYILSVIVLTYQSSIMMAHSTPAIPIEIEPVANVLQCKHSQ